MGHLYLTTSLYAHPAIIEAGPSPFVVWVSSLCWMNANSRDGSIPKDQAKAILRRLGTNRASINRLMRAGLFVDAGDRYVIPQRAGISGLDLWKLGPRDQPSRPPIPARVRELVYARDGYACRHCGSTERLSIDHIIPWSKGGAHEESNFQTLCRSCNSSKGART